MTKTVNLYTTLGCHLCDDALQLLRSYNAKISTLEVIEIEIVESDVLVERYGIRIPVVQLPSSKAELGWPFDAIALEKFLEEE